MYIFVLWIFYALAVSAVFVLRRTRPDAKRPYRVWGYPVVPALFVLVALYLLVNTLVATPRRALLGLVLIAIGLPVYLYYRRRAAQIVGLEPAESSVEAGLR
jgi:APA family basic amino acid/polyamine antiporter